MHFLKPGNSPKFITEIPPHMELSMTQLLEFMKIMGDENILNKGISGIKSGLELALPVALLFILALHDIIAFVKQIICLVTNFIFVLSALVTNITPSMISDRTLANK